MGSSGGRRDSISTASSELPILEAGMGGRSFNKVRPTAEQYIERKLEQQQSGGWV